MPTPTNRPFFANFLAGFRAHSALSKPHPSSGSTSTSGSSPSSFNSLVASQTRSLATAASQAQKTTPSAAATTTTSSTTNPANNNTSTNTGSVQANLSHHSRSVASASNSTAVVSRSPPTSSGNGFQHRVSPQQRRGSDSSSDGGFRDALGGEKWYIGGRTAGGEERFYRLGMVKKERSGDRLSLDRLSL